MHKSPELCDNVVLNRAYYCQARSSPRSGKKYTTMVAVHFFPLLDEGTINLTNNKHKNVAKRSRC